MLVPPLLLGLFFFFSCVDTFPQQLFCEKLAFIPKNMMINAHFARTSLCGPELNECIVSQLDVSYTLNKNIRNLEEKACSPNRTISETEICDDLPRLPDISNPDRDLKGWLANETHKALIDSIVLTVKQDVVALQKILKCNSEEE